MSCKWDWLASGGQRVATGSSAVFFSQQGSGEGAGAAFSFPERASRMTPPVTPTEPSNTRLVSAPNAPPKKFTRDIAGLKKIKEDLKTCDDASLQLVTSNSRSGYVGVFWNKGRWEGRPTFGRGKKCPHSDELWPYHCLLSSLRPTFPHQVTYGLYIPHRSCNTSTIQKRPVVGSI